VPVIRVWSAWNLVRIDDIKAAHRPAIMPKARRRDYRGLGWHVRDNKTKRIARKRAPATFRESTKNL